MAPTHIREGLPPILTTDEVAELLRLNPRTVLIMARDGRLPGHRLPGCRKFQFLAGELLATLADAPAGDDTAVSGPTTPGTRRAVPAEVDPCDVWGAAPSIRPGEDWRQRCRTHWLELAKKAGLVATAVDGSDYPSEAKQEERSAGRVDVDGLLYEVLVGPRQRTRYVDDDGEGRWGLIDAVWVQPVLVAGREVRSEAAWRTA